MTDIKTIEDLRVWQQARVINKEIYKFTRRPDFEKDYRFVQQIRAAAGSIMDNIAEGFERDGNKEFLQFLSIAKGSCGEVRSQLYRAYDIGYIEQETFDSLIKQTKKLSSSIYFFMQSIRKAEIKGNKYKQ